MWTIERNIKTEMDDLTALTSIDRLEPVWTDHSVYTFDDVFDRLVLFALDFSAFNERLQYYINIQIV